MITLIRPPAVETVRVTTSSLCPPLGLAYIAGALKVAGHETRVIDSVGADPGRWTRYYKGYLVGLPLREIVRRIGEESTVVGISCIFTHEWPAVVELIRLVKKARPGVKVVVGGEHVTAMPEFSLRTSLADALVLGEGEETVVELMAAWQGGRSPAGIPGVACREGDRVVVGPRRARRKDVDAIALPEWDRFDLEAYHRHRLAGGIYTGRLSVPILATRGCPYQCTYCSSPNMWTAKWIPRDPAAVADEIEAYVRRYGAGNFPFQDLTAVIRRDWILRFCDELIRRDLAVTWQLPSGTRSEAIDGEVARKLAASGMLTMSYAPESGSDEIRRVIKKRMDRGRCLRSLSDASAAGLSVTIFLVLGFPQETGDTMKANIPFLEDAAAAGATDLAIGYYMALPGTELFRSLYREGKIRIDRRYFRHILHGIAFFPSTVYGNLSRLRLVLWKLRLYFAFYRRAPRTSPSKLPTALRYAFQCLFRIPGAWLAPRWVSRRRERRMFDGWDELHREITGGTESLPRPLLGGQQFPLELQAPLHAGSVGDPGSR